jgi:two-component system sensor histidine kinase RegB
MVSPVPPRTSLGRDWLVRLRWGQLVGLSATALFGAFGLDLSPQPAVLVGLLVAMVASNLALGRSEREGALPAAMLLDLGLLTGLLLVSGGASNPFSVLYLLHVALAAVLLSPGWTSVFTLLAVLGFGGLFPFTDPHAMHKGGAGVMAAHLWGMWAAFAVTGAGISWFVARLARALRDREAELEGLRRDRETRERVLSLGTLAAGAAHELGSPLAAVAVSAREVEWMAGDNVELREEARSIRAAVERCKSIVGRLTQRAGAGRAEAAEEVELYGMLSALRDELSPKEAERLRLPAPGEAASVRAPPVALAEALRSVLSNALRAGPGEVRVEVRAEGATLRLEVQDVGEGMAAAVLARAGEPFFTTRPTGEGMGLGLFLARQTLEGLGGTLRLRSSAGRGTQVELVIPRRSEE